MNACPLLSPRSPLRPGLVVAPTRLFIRLTMSSAILPHCVCNTACSATLRPCMAGLIAHVHDAQQYLAQHTPQDSNQEEITAISDDHALLTATCVVYVIALLQLPWGGTQTTSAAQTAGQPASSKPLWGLVVAGPVQELVPRAAWPGQAEAIRKQSWHGVWLKPPCGTCTRGQQKWTSDAMDIRDHAANKRPMGHVCEWLLSACRHSHATMRAQYDNCTRACMDARAATDCKASGAHNATSHTAASRQRCSPACFTPATA